MNTPDLRPAPVFAASFPTRFGPFSVAVDEHGRVVGTAFGRSGDLLELLAREGLEDEGRTNHAREQLREYFAGSLREFDLSIAPAGTAFQRRVWERLRRVPYGCTISYGALARELGSSARAVGRANATNPICVIVPCHRVIGADGSLTGFAFGEEMKRKLLEHEGALLPLA